VTVSMEGTVEQVTLLEAPSDSIGRATVDAVERWQFTLITKKRVTVSGKLTFYFTLEGNKGRVLYPSEAGYIGPRGHQIRQTPSRVAVK
jgi:hypothetical protein